MDSQAPLSVKRNLKIGTFHLGSTMADVLGSGVWNRVMKDLGFAATPISLLLGLRYFLVPLAVWAGQQSDHTNVRGYRRFPWIFGGRLMMIVGYLLVAFSTVEIVRYGSIWWVGIATGFLLVSIGYSISGSTFLALLYDRSPAHQHGRVVGVVWTFLIAGYAVAGILFDRLLPEYEEIRFLEFFVFINLLMLIIWVFALWGEEKPYTTPASMLEKAPTFREMMREVKIVWADRNARLLAWFILLSFSAGFMQDPLLEPFGGTVFGLSLGETSRFQSYWGTTAILSSIAAIWGYRRFKAYGYLRLSRWGVILLLITFVGLIAAAYSQQVSLLRTMLLLLGVGYGLWNIGTLGLMVENSREAKAGLDLGIWTMITTLCRGIAITLGGVFFDLFVWGFDSETTAYALVFAIEAMLLGGALIVLHQMTPGAEAAPLENDMLIAVAAD